MRINGNEIREYRERYGISVDEMAEILHIDGEALYEYEGGAEWIENDPLTLYVINSICEDLDFIEVDIQDIYRKYGY